MKMRNKNQREVSTRNGQVWVERKLNFSYWVAGSLNLQTEKRVFQMGVGMLMAWSMRSSS
ncbi:hypothetical protein CsatB_017603 [Cannabis sativa]